LNVLEERAEKICDIASMSVPSGLQGRALLLWAAELYFPLSLLLSNAFTIQPLYQPVFSLRKNVKAGK
jgi:hypothetical protein